MDTQSGVTLTTVLGLLQPEDRIYILQRIEPHVCEIAGRGTVGELSATCCVEGCGDCTVESLALDTDVWSDLWPEMVPPVLVITIGRSVMSDYDSH